MNQAIPTDRRRLTSKQPHASDENYLGQFIPLHYHYNMLQDEDRVGAFCAAIELCVKPGMHVVELGGGTGILSFLAARQGARVKCVERNPELVRSARRLIKLNGVADSVEVVAADAREFVPQQPVDVVICEMLHVAMLREKQLEVIAAFKENYTRTHSDRLPRFLPEGSLLLVQPVEQSFDYAGYWAPVPLFQAPVAENQRTQELGEFTPYASILYDEGFPTKFHWSGQLSIARLGQLTALRFATQNAVAINLAENRAVTWANQCLVLPVDEPLHVEPGQSLDVSFQYAAGDSIDALARSLRIQTTGTEYLDSRIVA